MTVITVRVDDETRRMMKEIKINWSEFIREAIARKIEEEKRKNIAKAVLINEKLRRRSKSEPSAEEIIRMFREAQYTASSD
jgi:Arc/MetJ-type ribon-helix-helix transcriptional regulator